MKRRISIAVDKDDNQIPNAAWIPKAEVWRKENREGMEDVARFIAKNGSFADENRNW